MVINSTTKLLTSQRILQRFYSQTLETSLPKAVKDKRQRLYRRDSRSLQYFDTSAPAKKPEDNMEQIINTFAQKNQSNMDLKALLEFGRHPNENTLLQSSIRLYEELPIRLAQKVIDLTVLPHDLNNMPAIKDVRNLYEASFKELVFLPKPDSISLERKLTNHVKDIYERHSGVLWNCAMGVYQLKEKHKKETLARFSLPETFPGIQTFLDHFFDSRLDIRMMIGQHIALHEHIEGWVGLFCLTTNPAEIAHNAVRSATKACLHRYNKAPKVDIAIKDEIEPFPYVPAFLHHILFELLKNSMRAVIDAKINHNIKIEIYQGSNADEVIIDVIDRGGGFESEKEIERSWSYMYTTATEEDCRELFQELHKGFGRDFDANEHGLPIAGLGFGLPISRVFAQYLGGDLKIFNNKEGDGAVARLIVVTDGTKIKGGRPR